MKGFDRVMPRHLLSMLPPEGLQKILEGSTHLDVNELRRATTYDGYDPNGPYMRSFWRLVASWPKEKQKQLVKFVSQIHGQKGSRRIRQLSSY